jgi:hypothetical protein
MEAVPKLSEAQEELLRGLLTQRERVRSLCGKIRDKVRERDELLDKSGGKTNVQGRNDFIEAQSGMLLDALPNLAFMYNALPMRVPELYGPAAKGTLRKVLALDEPSDGDGEETHGT